MLWYQFSNLWNEYADRKIEKLCQGEWSVTDKKKHVVGIKVEINLSPIPVLHDMLTRTAASREIGNFLKQHGLQLAVARDERLGEILTVTILGSIPRLDEFIVKYLQGAAPGGIYW